MPNCDKCAVLKEELAKFNINGVVVDAAEDEGVAEIRKIYPKIKDKITRVDGSFPFPTLLLLDDNSEEILHIVHNAEQLREKIN